MADSTSSKRNNEGPAAYIAIALLVLSIIAILVCAKLVSKVKANQQANPTPYVIKVPAGQRVISVSFINGNVCYATRPRHNEPAEDVVLRTNYSEYTLQEQ